MTTPGDGLRPGNTRDSSTDPRIGLTIDARYTIERRLGDGGTGVVYAARHSEMDRVVAIKILRGDLFLGGDAVERFRREARAAGRLRHPHAVTIHDFGRTDLGDLFLVMELCEGGSLGDRLRDRSRLDFADVLEIFLPVTAAVGSAHAAGVVHRDLKPANVLFAGDAPKVADFGLARMVEEADSTLTGGYALGSPAYMSPEQCAGREAGPSSDVYSLGIMMFQALAGRFPFQAATLPAVLNAHILGHLEDPRTIEPPVVEGMCQVLSTALAHDPTARYPDAGALHQALAALRQGRLAQRLPSAGRATSSRLRTVTGTPTAQIGRRRELAVLLAGVESAQRGGGMVLAIAGEPGLGKSTLLQALLQEVADGRSELEEPIVGFGRCSEQFGKGEAYLPFFDALGFLLAGRHRKLIEGLLRSVAPTWAAQLPVLAPTAEQIEGVARERDRMPRELGDFLAAASAQRALVLALEDLHWSDQASVDLLSFLASRIGTLKVAMVVTYRPEDIERTRHPLGQVLRRLRQREGQFAEIRPASLSREETGELVERELGARAPDELVDLIVKVTEGNPLFVVNAARHLESSGAILKSGSRVLLLATAAELETSIPQGLAGLLEDRIGRLEEGERTLLQAASVLGESFEAAAVARLLERDELEVEEALTDVSRRHRLIDLGGELEYPSGLYSLRFRFVHALYQNAFYASVVGRRRAQWHAAAAQALRDLWGRQLEPVAVALAVHLEKARDLDGAIEAYVAAADVVGRAAPRDAAPLLARALELAGRLAGDQANPRRAGLLVRLARLDAETAELVGDPSLYDRAEAYALQALELEPGSADARTTLALIRLERGDNDAAFADFVDVLRRQPDFGAAWDGLAYLFKNTGLWQEALLAADRASAADPRFRHSIRRLSALIFLERIPEAIHEADALVAGRPRFSHYAYWRGIAAFYADDLEGCRSWVERGHRFDPDDLIGQGVLAFVLAWNGDSARARSLVAAAEVGAAADGTFTYWIANVYAALGEVDLAIDWLRRASHLGYWNAPWIERDRAVQRIRHDPRFGQLLAEISSRRQAFAEAVLPVWEQLVG